MATNKRNAVYQTEWERLISSLTANSTDLPHLETAKADLQKKLDDIRQFLGEQALHQAAKQDATQRLAAAVHEGRQLANFMRTGIRQRFGKDSEKLIEFGVSPFRSKRRKSEGDTTPKPVPPASGVTVHTTPA